MQIFWFILSLLFLYRHVSETVLLEDSISPMWDSVVEAQPRMTQGFRLCK